MSKGGIARNSVLVAAMTVSASTISNAGDGYGILPSMDAVQKITVGISSELLAKAQRASGAGITETVRAGLQLVAASEAYARLRQLRGKVRFSRSAADLKADR
jgi:hypothetical protein